MAFLHLLNHRLESDIIEKNVKGFFYFQELETLVEPLGKSNKQTRFVIVL